MNWFPGVYGLNPFQLFWPQMEAVDVTTGASGVYADPVTSGSLLSTEELKLYSLKALERFTHVWDFDNFWKRGNTCDACIALADAMITNHPDELEVKQMVGTVQEMLEKNLVYYKTVDHKAMWVDDFAWWGLMSLNAYELLKKLGNETLAKEYFDLANECWTYLVKQGYDKSEDAKPVVHGCRNNAAESTDGGVKNTVVNASLLLLSTRLYQLSGEAAIPLEDRKPFLEMAGKQWNWFSQWFELDSGYLKSFNGNAALVSERPYVANSNYQDLTHPDWSLDSKGWFWTGDHGLLIGGLIDLLSLKNELSGFLDSNFDLKVVNILQQLVRGVEAAMIGDDGLFYEPPCLTSYQGYGNDYFGGRGILVRYMDSKAIKALTGVNFSANITETVKVLWSTRDENTNQFKLDLTSLEQNRAYFKKFASLLGFSDDVSTWNINADDAKFIDAAPQAVGIDFLAAAYLSQQ